MKRVLGLVVVNTLDYFRTDKRTFRDDALEGHHVVEVGRAERTWVARKLSKISNVGAVVNLGLSAKAGVALSFTMVSQYPLQSHGRDG